MGNHEPGDDKVEQEDGIDGQGLPVLGLTLAEEHKCCVRGPHKARHCRDEAQCKPQLGLDTGHNQDHLAQQQRTHHRCKTVAQDTDGLEKGAAGKGVR